jgi:hypothetical protein
MYSDIALLSCPVDIELEIDIWLYVVAVVLFVGSENKE